MSTDQLEALRIAGIVTGPADEVFARAFQRLTEAIADEAIADETMPEATSAHNDGVARVSGLRSAHSAVRRPRYRFRIMAVAGTIVAIAAASLVVALVPGSVGQKLPIAEAAQLRLIAANAGHQPVLQLGPNQWLRTSQVSVVSLTVNHQVPDGEFGGRPVVTDEPIPGAAASARVVSTEWFNNTGQACVSLRLSPVIFASSANRTSWKSAGLIAQAPRSSLSDCVEWEGANAYNGFAKGIGAVNVSSLTSNPALLARQLESGTTGIQGLDQGASKGNQGFEEAVSLLMGPLTGKSSSFGSELYTAIALIPGIDKLGKVTTSSGQVGLGFAADTSLGRVAIVVDPNSGKLLEVQNDSVRALESELAGPSVTNALSPKSANLEAEGVFVVAQVQSSDTSGGRSIVKTSALPKDLQPQPAPVAVIVATAKPDVGGFTVTSTPQLNDPINVLERQLESQLGAPGGGSGLDPMPGAATVYLTFTGSKSQVDQWAQALRNSGLFVTVDVNWGDIPTSSPGL